MYVPQTISLQPTLGVDKDLFQPTELVQEMQFLPSDSAISLVVCSVRVAGHYVLPLRSDQSSSVVRRMVLALFFIANKFREEALNLAWNMVRPFYS